MRKILGQIFLSERNMMAAILFNSIIIFLLYFPQIEEDRPGLYNFFEVVDHLFILFFVLEAVLKLKAFGTKGYFKSSWNIFDFVIVIISLPGLLTFIPFFANHNFSFIKVLRLIRVIRLLRVVSFIPRMGSILSGLARALKASVFVIVVLIVLNFLIALFTCHIYGEILPEYFGDPLISSYYIFQLFTVEGWYEIPQLILDATEGEGLISGYLFASATRFYFILVVLFGGVFGLSLANAIFVDEMTSDNNKELEDKIDVLITKINQLEEKIGKG